MVSWNVQGEVSQETKNKKQKKTKFQRYAEKKTITDCWPHS